jgi:sugar phosphate isomerase/epimerase
VDPDPKVQAAVLLALGARHIEVRSAWGVNVSELRPEQVAELKKTLDAKGLKVSAVASPIGKVDIGLPAEHEVSRLRQIISVAKGLDTRYIRIFSFFRGENQTQDDIRDDVLTRMRALAREAESAGVVLLHENEKGIYGDTPQRVLDLMESVDSPALRVAWDNANFVQVGVKPYTEGYALP